MKFHFVLALLLGLITAPLTAQQSSKSKSKDRFREKTNPAGVVVQNARALNGAGNDYGLAYYQNGLVFVGNRPRPELLFAPFDPNAQPTAPQALDLGIRGLEIVGPVTFSRDGNTVVFNCKAGAGLRICEAQRTPQGWSNVRELPFNLDTAACLQPTLSADGRTLYFASSRAGGYGGLDLWKAERMADGQSWFAPVNLGPNVNSAGNDNFPFASPDGTLFFSSNGRSNGLGGYDLFYCELNGAVEPTVVSLGAPFNSAGNDYGLIVSDDGRSGFFVSDRAGGFGQNDIYSFQVTQ